MKKPTGQADLGIDRKLLDEHEEDLPVPLTHDEFIERAQALVALSAEEAQADAEFQSARDKHKGRCMAIHERRVELEEAIRTRAEPRPVLVQEFADYSTNTCRAVRADTGEVLSERALAPGERQRAFEFQGAEEVQVTF